jgi:hypothetical protein
VPENVYWIVDDLFWKELPAPLGKVSVTRRWSVALAVSALRLFNETPDWITGREVSTDDVEPPQV